MRCYIKDCKVLVRTRFVIFISYSSNLAMSQFLASFLNCVFHHSRGEEFSSDMGMKVVV